MSGASTVCSDHQLATPDRRPSSSRPPCYLLCKIRYKTR